MRRRVWGLALLGLLLLLHDAQAAVVLSERDWQALKRQARSNGPTFPTAPVTNDLFLLTNDSGVGICDPTGGIGEVTLCRWTGSVWSAVVGTSAPVTVTLDAAYDGGRVIDGATLAAPVEISNGTQGVEIGGDATLGGFIRPKPLGDSTWRCWTNFNCIIRDEEAAATMFTIDPDAASKNAMYQFGTNYKPIASFLLPLEPRGAATSAAESITTNVEKAWYLTVTDADTDAADFSFPVTARMAGATTATFRLVGVSTNASPSGNIALDCAMSTYTPGTDTLAAHSTTGQQRITLTPATQYRPVAGTSSAHTINGGSLVEGDIVYGSCEVDATATTSAQMTNFRLWGNVLVQLSVNSWSD